MEEDLGKYKERRILSHLDASGSPLRLQRINFTTEITKKHEEFRRRFLG
ncbi:MAG: hypothetical protein ABR969_04830 [Sedimentisphaerales bacterium]